MKTLLFTLIMVLTNAAAFAQTAAKTAETKNMALPEHLTNYSWLYLSLFVALIGVFVVGYLRGWDKKMFRAAKGGKDDNHLFI